MGKKISLIKMALACERAKIIFPKMGFFLKKILEKTQILLNRILFYLAIAKANEYFFENVQSSSNSLIYYQKVFLG